MMRARDRLPEHAGKITNIKAWLARLTNNLCVDMHRERRRHSKAVENIEELTNVGSEPALRLAESPEALLLRREARLYVCNLIVELPPGLQQPFVLRFFHENTYEEIAARLGLSNENVRKRVQQARALLRERLARPITEARESAAAADEEAISSMISIAENSSVYRRADIEPRARTTRLVRVTLPSGGARSFQVLVDYKSGPSHRIETLDKYVHSYPGGWKKRWERACLLYESGRWAEAVEEHRRVIERQPKFVDSYLQLGSMLQLLEAEAEALEVYDRACDVVTQDATRHHICGLIHTTCRRHYEAAAEFQQACLLEPDHAIHRHLLGLAYLRAGSPVKALQTFSETLNAAPDDVVALTLSYHPLLLSGRTGEAGRRVERAVELDPENLLAVKWLIDYHIRSKDIGGKEGKKVRELLWVALRLSPEIAEVHESVALYHVFRGEWEKGLTVLRDFVERHPDSPAGWLFYARCAFHTGKTESAAAAIIQAARLDPGDCETQKAACQILAQTAATDRLRSARQRMLESHPDQWDVWAVAARLLFDRFREPERACVASAYAPRLQPRLAAAWFQHGRVLALSNRHLEAISSLREGWKWLPGDADDDQAAEAALWLGESHRLLGDEKRAGVWFERAARQALSLSLQHPSVKAHRRGQAMEALGDRLGALQNYRTALSHHLLYPARGEVERKLQRLEARARPGGLL